MRVRAVAAHPWEVDADVLAFSILEDAALVGELAALDQHVGGTLGRLRAFGELSGRLGGTALFPTGPPAQYLLAVGLGPPIEDDPRIAAHHFGAQAVRRLAGRAVHRLALWLGDDAVAAAELATRGLAEGDYDPGTLYRTDLEEPPAVIDELILVGPPGADVEGIAAAGERGLIGRPTT